MSLRDEIAALVPAHHLASGDTCPNCQMIRKVLAIVDRHEAKLSKGSVRLTTYRDGDFLASESIPIDVPKHTVRWPIATQEVEVEIRICEANSEQKPEAREERPAREQLRKMRGIGHTEAVEAIVEALDANTQAVREQRVDADKLEKVLSGFVYQVECLSTQFLARMGR